MPMHAAAETSTLIAVCFRCQARFRGPEPLSCPGCGGAVILEMQGFARAASVVEIHSAGQGEPSEETPAGGPSFLPGVHVAPQARERLAQTGEFALAPRLGGGTSVHASARRRRERRDSGLALKLLSMAALLATFAFFLQAAH
jgi:hypothetical protein